MDPEQQLASVIIDDVFVEGKILYVFLAFEWKKTLKFSDYQNENECVNVLEMFEWSPIRVGVWNFWFKSIRTRQRKLRQPETGQEPETFKHVVKEHNPYLIQLSISNINVIFSV